MAKTILVNGVRREMTPEEKQAFDARQAETEREPDPEARLGPTLQEQVRQLQEEVERLKGGK